MRDVLLHVHIFKNSGTSIDHLLHECFGARWGKFEGPFPWSIVHAADLEKHLQEHPELKALSSHQVRPPLPHADGLKVHPIVLLRHPIDRIGSVYAFDTRDRAEKTDREFQVYIRTRLKPEWGPMLSNYQVACLAENPPEIDDQRHLPAGAPQLEQAKDFLRSLSAFGLVERFDDSLQLLQRTFAPHFGELRFAAAVHRNRSRARSGTLEQRLEQMRGQLGADLYARLEAANALDLELHSFASNLFDERQRTARSPFARLFRKLTFRGT